MAPVALNRIHSILKHAVAMRDEEIDRIVQQTEGVMNELGAIPALRACLTPEGWLPIASVLNYSPLGAVVWPYGGVGVVADCLNARGSTAVELSGDGSCVRKRPLRVQLRTSLEFIFGDSNYHKDVHLHLLQDTDGYAPLERIASTYHQFGELIVHAAVASSGAPTDVAKAFVLREALASSAELVMVPPPDHGAARAGKLGLVRRKTLAEKICSQVEYYLGDERLQQDRYLYEQQRDFDGWIPIATLLTFPRMRKLCHPQVGAVSHVLSASKRLEVSADQALVRPSRAVPSSPARSPSTRYAVDTPPAVFKRAFEPPTPLAVAPEAAPTGDFSLMTYNILADMLCTIEQFPGVDVQTLDWDRRKALVLAEVGEYAPDVLCLQELQGNAAGAGVDDHHSALARELGRSGGYASRYVRKVKRTGATWPSAQIGNAVFWRAEIFDEIEHEQILIAPALHAACDDEPSAAHFGRGAQVGLAVALRHKLSGRELVVVTTHLSCNFQEPSTQVAQAHVVLTAAGRLAAKHGPETAVVLAADLNSIPGSGVYHLITSRALSASHPHRAVIAESACFPSFGEHGGGSSDLTQPLHLSSTYGSVLGQEPLFTNFTPTFVGTLDYIFCSPSLAPTQVLALPSEDEVRAEGFLPASRFPSDHLPLCAKLCFVTPPPDPPAHPRVAKLVASDIGSPSKRPRSEGGGDAGRDEGGEGEGGEGGEGKVTFVATAAEPRGASASPPAPGGRGRRGGGGGGAGRGAHQRGGMYCTGSDK